MIPAVTVCPLLQEATLNAVRNGNGELKDWLGRQGDLVESGFPDEWEGRGLVEGLVLQSEDLQMLTHSYVQHITICQLL